jgi:hypothetical protein
VLIFSGADRLCVPDSHPLMDVANGAGEFAAAAKATDAKFID